MLAHMVWHMECAYISNVWSHIDTILHFFHLIELYKNTEIQFFPPSL